LFAVGVAAWLEGALGTVARRAGSLVAAAHRVCPYSNATRNNIEVKLVANGQPVA
jgi:organic hydroperoxide reductase OsmC/OhrA